MARGVLRPPQGPPRGTVGDTRSHGGPRQQDGAPAGDVGQAHGHALVLALAQAHVAAGGRRAVRVRARSVRTARGRRAALAQVRVALHACWPHPRALAHATERQVHTRARMGAHSARTHDGVGILLHALQHSHRAHRGNPRPGPRVQLRRTSGPAGAPLPSAAAAAVAAGPAQRARGVARAELVAEVLRGQACAGRAARAHAPARRVGWPGQRAVMPQPRGDHLRAPPPTQQAGALAAALRELRAPAARPRVQRQGLPSADTAWEQKAAGAVQARHP